MPCTNFFDLFAVAATMSVSLDKAGGPARGAATMIEDTTAPLDCADGEQTTGPVTVTPLALNYDGDVAAPGITGPAEPDRCPAWKELGTNQFQGGRRDPFNPWDYFNPTKDGKNRTDDILAVVAQYYIDYPDPRYTQQTDRTAGPGPNPWNLGPPDGLQRSDDILYINDQYRHDCS